MGDGSDDAESTATIRHAAARSINLIDTVLVYGVFTRKGEGGRALEGLREIGRIRAIGVSNFCNIL
ncbi:general stress protein [Pandoraea horticolens]|uniref:General stress protein n=1 Tax=Pandoraea horticolens TaxID=2508298 RepID=A0A5E4T715_9BURK|nr:hypothetical protein [Pandoraea horticolens]VVD84056.1 general stress protein [Pandoraea horticolens]